ncbi:MAG: hypothetical protein U0074_01940 [Kouleothrix sp.]
MGSHHERSQSRDVDYGKQHLLLSQVQQLKLTHPSRIAQLAQNLQHSSSRPVGDSHRPIRPLFAIQNLAEKAALIAGQLLFEFVFVR